MHWLFAIIGMVLGTALAAAGLGGAAAGFLVGWLLGREIATRNALAALGERLRRLEAGGGAEAAIERARETAARARDAERAAPAAVPPMSETATARAASPEAPAISPIPATPIATEPAVEPVPEPVAEPVRVADAAPQRPAPPPLPPRIVRPTASAFPRWLTEGNIPVKIGVLVLFVGVAAALKYAVDQGLFSLPIELRLAFIGAAAIGALLFGWRERVRRRVFGLSIQGGALGVLMLTVFAAYARYDLLPAPLAFGLFVAAVAGGALLALLQDALALAVLAVIGGFLAPVLINTGSNNYVGLFSYYALLNAGIFAIAWVRPWRVLNLVGFAFTFIVGLAWGIDRYKPEYFATTEPFLVLFFLFYVAIAVLYALRQPGARRGFVDGTLVFGVPLVAFPLQAALLGDDRMGLAYSALAVAALYGLLARLLMPRDGLRTLAISFAALAVGFATLAVPLALSAQWTTCAWALEGAALVWLGLRQRHALATASGLALQFLAAIAWLGGLPPATDVLPEYAILNGPFLAGALLSLSALYSAHRLERDGGWPRAAIVAFIAGCTWYLCVGVREVEAFVAPEERIAALALFAALTIALGGAVRRALGWERIAWPMLVAYGAGFVLALGTWNDPPLYGLGHVAWPAFALAGAAGLYLLARPRARGLSLAHVAWLAAVSTVAGFTLNDASVRVFALGDAWSAVALALPLALITWATWSRPRLGAWPLADEFPEYAVRWFAPAAVALTVWLLASLANAGDPQPLVYLPLLNPLELAQVGVLALLFGLARGAERGSAFGLRTLVLAAAFVTISVATVRAVHHLAPLPWNASLLEEMLTQTALTVVWSVIGVAAWIMGSRRGSRALWMCGAVLMGVVLAKLVVVDRTYMGNVAGIVSFLAVGLLLTAVGYFAPSPPRTIAAPAEA